MSRFHVEAVLNIEIVLRSLDRRASHEIVVDSIGTRLHTCTPARPQSLSCGERVSLVERNIKSLSLYYLPCFSQRANFNQCQSLPERWLTPPTSNGEPPQSQSQSQWITMNPLTVMMSSIYSRGCTRSRPTPSKIQLATESPSPEPGAEHSLLCTRISIQTRS